MLVTGNRWTSSPPTATDPKSLPVGIWPSAANNLEAQAIGCCEATGCGAIDCGTPGTDTGTCPQAGADRAVITRAARTACLIVASCGPTRAADSNRITGEPKEHSPRGHGELREGRQ